VIADLFLVLQLRVGDDNGYEDSEDIFKELEGKVELGPVVSLLHDVENVAWRAVSADQDLQSRGDEPLKSILPSK